MDDGGQYHVRDLTTKEDTGSESYWQNGFDKSCKWVRFVGSDLYILGSSGAKSK